MPVILAVPLAAVCLRALHILPPLSWPSFFCCCVHHRALHSFPTRRSSDLNLSTVGKCLPPDCPRYPVPLELVARTSELFPRKRRVAVQLQERGRHSDFF